LLDDASFFVLVLEKEGRKEGRKKVEGGERERSMVNKVGKKGEQDRTKRDGNGQGRATRDGTGQNGMGQGRARQDRTGWDRTTTTPNGTGQGGMEQDGTG
jgi:hypothetical protein